MINYDRLSEYRKGVRPVGPESLPAWVERELSRLGDVIRDQNAAIRDLNARLVTQETP